jgi:hypothetical protein
MCYIGFSYGLEAIIVYSITIITIIFVEYYTKFSNFVFTLHRPDIIPTDEECSICHDKYDDSTVQLHDKHYFHNNCITDWLNINRSCPMCRCQIYL